MSDEKKPPLNCDRDAARWAREFNDVMERQGLQRIDEGWMISWFANAMMCGEDTYRWKLEKEGRFHPEATHVTWRLVKSDTLPEGAPVYPGTTLYAFYMAPQGSHWEYDLPDVPTPQDGVTK